MEFYLASSWIGKDDGRVIRTSKCFDPGGYGRVKTVLLAVTILRRGDINVSLLTSEAFRT